MMTSGKRYLVLDYETFSECDIKESGAWEYSKHRSTEILCAAYVYGTKDELKNQEPKIWVPEDRNVLGKYDTLFIRLLNDPDVTLVAHNALFEQVITRNVLTRYSRVYMGAETLKDLPVSRWVCTASLARSRGLPGSLDGATSALGLKHTKDKEGHRLMLKLCKPRKPTKTNSSTKHDDPLDFERLVEYCAADVKAEVDLFLTLPDLTPKEREAWELDQTMNLRGFAVDRLLVKNALRGIEREVEKLDKRFSELTGLDSARQRDETLKVLKRAGLVLPDLRAGTVADALARNDLDSFCRTILQTRQAISKSSTAKYKAFWERSKSDGRARDNTIYFGAHTGRQAGTGLQPQNLFKATISQTDVDYAITLLRNGQIYDIPLEFENPMEVYASCLRGCIIAPKGKVLEVGDFATVEVRVLFWLAGHQRGLDDIASGKDIYLSMAAKIFKAHLGTLVAAYKDGKPKAKNARQLGKQTVLGAGFGIGVNGQKFQATAKAYGMDIDIELAKTCIQAYRELHAPIPAFWEVIERSAMLAVQHPNRTFKHGKLAWCMEGDWLACKLPSGRSFYYYKPKLQKTVNMYGEKIALTYMGVDSITKKYIRMTTWGGKLTENVVQAVARDLLVEALLRLEKTHAKPVLAVHDEIVCESEALTDMVKVMSEPPLWADGLPIKVEGWKNERYRK